MKKKQKRIGTSSHSEIDKSILLALENLRKKKKMKRVTSFLLFYLVFFLSLLTFFGCGGAEDAEELGARLI